MAHRRRELLLMRTLGGQRPAREDAALGAGGERCLAGLCAAMVVELCPSVCSGGGRGAVAVPLGHLGCTPLLGAVLVTLAGQACAANC